MEPQYITLNGRAVNITNQKFGRLLALGPVGYGADGKIMWLCQCECGEFSVVRGTHLTAGKILSCGCLQRELAARRETTHGLHNHRVYRIWHHALDRCANPHDAAYPNYGGRGITMYGEWRENFQAFYDYVILLPHYGEAGRSLDRVDNSKGYFPGNLRWATAKEQSRNRRYNRPLIHDGRIQGLSVWAEEMGIPASRLAARLRLGWSIEDALMIAVGEKRL